MNADSYGDALDCTLKEITKLREQVAAQAAVIERLRKCLQASVAGLEFRKQHLMRGISDAIYEDRMEAAIDKIKEALATTDSTQILDEVRRAERERCAKVCEDLKKNGIDYFMADSFAAAIRAME